MSEHRRVMVRMDDVEVEGLLLKWGRQGERALVTYEVDGKVATTWVRAVQLRTDPDQDGRPEPVPD